MTDPAFTPGQRVKLAAYLDRWMRGDRHGVIIKAGRGGRFHVKLDTSGQTCRFFADDLELVV